MLKKELCLLKKVLIPPSHKNAYVHEKRKYLTNLSCYGNFCMYKDSGREGTLSYKYTSP